jgi:hypothetical protein
MSGPAELICDGERRLALIIRGAQTEERVQFFSDPADSLQVGAFALPQGHEIMPHVHQKFTRTLDHTAEVLILQAGRLRVDFYSIDRTYLQSRELVANDVIVLFDGGHGFVVLEDVRMLEVKQGPYGGDRDKTRFARPGGGTAPA